MYTQKYTSTANTNASYNAGSRMQQNVENVGKVKCEVLKAINIEIIIFWDVIPCTPVQRHQHFRGTYLTTQSKFRTGSHDKCYVTFLSSSMSMMNQYKSHLTPHSLLHKLYT